MGTIIATSTGETDSAYHTLVKHIQSPIPIVMVSWTENFIFNTDLLNLKEYILVDYNEYGWDAKLTETHIWGKNSENFPRYYNGDWIKFDNWVKENPPKLFFKRELLKKDAIGNIFPIDYTASTDILAVQTRENFNSRPLSVAYYFGRSHEERLRLHARIWDGATRHGYNVCDNLYYFVQFMQNENGKKYASMNIPHYVRHPIEDLLHVNGMAKIGIAPFGAGQKTFRHAEVSSNAVMLTWENDLAWAADWIHGYNCLICKQGEEVETIEKWNNYPRLYDIYLEGIKTWDKYRTSRYINDYLNPIINQAASEQFSIQSHQRV